MKMSDDNTYDPERQHYEQKKVFPGTKYQVFCGQQYYPKGGYLDLHAAFDDLEQAKKYIADTFPAESFCFEWAHIALDGKIIYDYGEDLRARGIEVVGVWDRKENRWLNAN
jgi:hypothetical protein